MTTYTNIPDSSIEPDDPITANLAAAWRDNPIAIGEADASVPLNLLPTVLLGTLNTTSGSSQTLSGLDLTPYKFLTIVLDGVGVGGGGSPPAYNILLGGVIIGAGPPVLKTLSFLELSSGLLFVGGIGNLTAYSNATTSLVFTITGGTFGAGVVRVWGQK